MTRDTAATRSPIHENLGWLHTLAQLTNASPDHEQLWLEIPYEHPTDETKLEAHTG
ncbi:MAG: hypothetical protein AB4042_12100 [Leptolyngbyaceae cyanobacterium]